MLEFTYGKDSSLSSSGVMQDDFQLAQAIAPVGNKAYGFFFPALSSASISTRRAVLVSGFLAS